MISIYVLVDPRTSRVRYVGKTCHSIERRAYQHVKAALGGNRSYRSSWIRQLITEGLLPEVVLIDVVPDEIWRETEREWILFYRNLGAPLTNHTHGGEGSSRSPSPETRLKISQSLKGHSCYKDPNRKRAVPQLGKSRDDVTRAKISATLKGRPKSVETRRHMSEAWDRRRTPEASARRSEALKRAWNTRRAND